MVRLGVSSADLSSLSYAERAISSFDDAIEKVSRVRRYFGTLQNRLEHTIENLSNTEENLVASESRIRDVLGVKRSGPFVSDSLYFSGIQSSF